MKGTRSRMKGTESKMKGHDSKLDTGVRTSIGTSIGTDGHSYNEIMSILVVEL